MNLIPVKWVHPLTAFLFWFARARSCGTPEFHWDSGHLPQGQLARACREEWHHHRYQLLSQLLFFFYIQCVGGGMCCFSEKLCSGAFRENLCCCWFPGPSSGNWDVTRECYTKYSSNYRQLMIVVTGKAVCVRNQLPTGCLVLLNPPWPPPALLNFWEFVRPCLAFAPRVGGPCTELSAAKIAGVCNQDQAWNQQNPSSVIKWSGCGLRDRICMSLFNLL